MFRAFLIAGLLALLLACGTPSAISPTPATSPQATIAPTVQDAPTEPPTAEVLATLATAAPELPSPAATIAAPEPTQAPEPTSAPRATLAPAAAPLGAAPKGSDCPADHPIKGNIVDRGANKGEKIYHIPGDNGYAQTKPERCFADVKEAEAAGFRAVK